MRRGQFAGGALADAPRASLTDPLARVRGTVDAPTFLQPCPTPVMMTWMQGPRVMQRRRDRDQRWGRHRFGPRPRVSMTAEVPLTRPLCNVENTPRAAYTVFLEETMARSQQRRSPMSRRYQRTCSPQWLYRLSVRSIMLISVSATTCEIAYVSPLRGGRLTLSISFDDLLKDLFGASMPDMTTG